MKKGVVVICKHAVFTADQKPIHGVASAIEPYLEKQKKDFVVINLPLLKGSPAHITRSIDNKITVSTKEYANQMPYLRYVSEFFILKQELDSLNRSVDLYIGVDPLNALWGIVLKKMNRASTVIFYTADYAKKRFANSLLNSIYHSIDLFCVNHADAVWNISSRITEEREHQMKKKRPNILVPNSPAYTTLPTDKKQPETAAEIALVTASTVSTDIPLILESISELKSKIPDIKLNIIGLESSKTLLSIVQKLKLQNNVTFTGHLDHDGIIKNILKAKVGIAMYTNQWDWNYYADSMKVREYSACGLPVVMTNVSSTAKDIQDYKAGLVINNDKEELVQALKQLLTDRNEYLIMQKNAVALAKKYNITTILDIALKEYL